MVKWLLFVDSPPHLSSGGWGGKLSKLRPLPKGGFRKTRPFYHWEEIEVKRETERQNDREGWREESLATEQPFALQGPPVWSNP